MRQPTNVTLFEYWNGLRGGRSVPARVDIEPGKISAILDRVFLLETEADGRITYRLAGSTICEQFGADLRNQDYLAFWPGRDRSVLASLFRDLAENGDVAIIESEALTRSGRDIVFEMSILPLSRPSGIDRFICAAVPIVEPAWHETGPMVAHHILQRTIFAPDKRAIPEPSVRSRPSVPPTPMFGRERRMFRVLDGGRANEPRTAEP